MKARYWFVASLTSALSLAGCGPNDNTGGNGDPNAGDGGNTTGDDPVTPRDGGGGGDDEFADARPDANCGLQNEAIEVVESGEPPDLLIVLDRSGSMGDPLDGFFPPSRWRVMSEALTTITAATDDQIRYGLAVYPSGDTCGVSAGAEVAIGDNTASAINSWLATSPRPLGATPSHLALTNAKAIYASMPVNPDGRYVLFATDGAPNCGDGNPQQNSADEVVAAVEALAAEGIKTYVLGFGDAGGLDTSNLDAAALAGGVPKPGGPPHYYSARSAAELQQALDDIAGGIIVPSCEWTLAEQPPDPDRVNVTLDGMPVPRSTAHTDGWDYYPDASTITLFGSYCEQVKEGTVTEVSFSFGCPGPVVD